MAIAADVITLKKLALAKQVFHRALVQSGSPNNIDKMMSVIMFDLATETTLNAVVTSLDSSKTPSDGIPSLLNQVDSILSKNGLGTCPERANIVHVHGIRNDAQHDARYPNPSEISDSQTYTRDFLRAISNLVWGLDFDKISLADLIQHQKICLYLKDAEELLTKKEYKKAIEKCVTGVDLALRNAGVASVGRTFITSWVKIVVEKNGRREGDGDLMKSIEKMRETLRLIALGLSPLDYLKFREIGGHPLFGMNDPEPVNFINDKKDPSKDEAEYVLSYSIDAILMIESRVGDIDKPFGKDYLHWY